MFSEVPIIYQCNTLTGTFELLHTLQYKVTAGEGREGKNGDEALN